MKFFLMYLVLVYVVACADDVREPGDYHPLLHRIFRAVAWPVTITSWFCSQGVRLNRLLNILWTLLIIGWSLSLIADRV